MFNTFTPLKEGELRTEIESFAKKVNFPIGRIDVMDGSRRSAHSNAYFSGFYVYHVKFLMISYTINH